MIDEILDEQEIEDGEASIYCQIKDCAGLAVEEEMHEGMVKKVCWEHYEGSR